MIMSEQPKIESYPPIQDCLKVIADKAGSKPGIVILALMEQARELNMEFDELVHTQYKTALSDRGETKTGRKLHHCDN